MKLQDWQSQLLIAHKRLLIPNGMLTQHELIYSKSHTINLALS
jgi:hypothetical protein